MRFRSILLSSGKTATGVEVPQDIVDALGSRRPKVKVTLGDYSYRSSVASRGGIYLLGVSTEVRTATGVKPGDELEIDLELDTDPREVAVPADLAEALLCSPVASTAFTALSYSNQRRLVMAIDSAKTAETRLRRIEKTVTELTNT